MTRKMVVTIVGWVFLVIGLLGFVPQAAPGGNLLGLFPVDTYHNLVHVVIGAIGIATSRQMGLAPKPYCQIFGAVFILLAILGLVLEGGMLGPIHLGGYDVYLHALIGLVLAYYGFVHKEV